MSKNVKIFLDKRPEFFYNGIYHKESFMPNGALMTIDDLSGYLKVTRRTIYEWLKENKIPAIKLVGQWRFKKDKIDDWIEKKSVH